MPLPHELLAILACPETQASLIYFPRGERDDDAAHGFLLCPASRLRFHLDGDVPVMLVEDADRLAPPEVARLVAAAAALGLPGATSAPGID